MMNCKDLVGQLIEEVALEGLDGITLQGLWLRLEDRKDFGMKPLTERVKSNLWNILIKLKCLDFYVLTEPRKLLVIYDKINCVNESGHSVLPPGYEDIYPHSAVCDETTGIMGSCKEFNTRQKVTEEIIKYTLNEAFTRWEMQLVIVADQETRRSALCGITMDPTWEFSVHEYCILERIGRSRQHGEITQGEYGLKQVNPDNKMLFYYRKCLVKRDLVTVQNFIVRIKNLNVSGKILHLKRFSVPVKSKVEMDVDTVIEFLKAMPAHTGTYQDVSKLPLRTDLKRVLKKVKNFVTENIPYRLVYPDAPVVQWKYKGSSTEKVLKVVRLVSEAKEEEDEEKDDEEDSGGLLDESNRCIGVPLVRQAYLAVERSHISGLTQGDIAKLLGLPHLQARSICRQLRKEKICGTTLRDSGRQRAGVFYCSKFDTLKASIPSEVAKEKSKLLEQISVDIPVRAVPYTVRKRLREPMQSDKPPPKVLKLEHKSSLSNSTVQTTKITLKKNSVDDTIKTEITILKPEVKPGRISGLLDGRDDSTNLSLRLLKRANLILKAVNNLKIIHDTQKLQRLINEEEEQEGSNYTVDRKSVLRILEKLELEGHLQRIKVTLTGAFKEKVMVFICHPSVSPNHSEIQSAIEQAKMKLPILTKDSNKCRQGPQTMNHIRQLNYDHRIGKTQYGFKPKFIRLRNMHFYLYYLIYNYTGNPNLSVITKRNILSNNNLDMNLLKEMGPVYLDKLDWKMFIPPLPVHKDYGKGWCLVSDLLLRLPLFMFLSMVNTPYRIPGIMDYLEHPLRKFYLVKDLPSDISYYLTIMRKYIFTLTDILQQLAYIGLLQFGPQMMKEKDQVFVYLNKRACLIDTTLSEEGYNHISTSLDYEQKHYQFDSTDDLERYWSDLVKYAMNTKLGSKVCVVGKEVVVESVSTKKQMLEALRAKSSEEALESDIGYIPGDGLGAAGIDSDLFVHLKRNWYWSSSIVKHNPEERTPKSSLLSKKALAAKSSKSDKLKKKTPNDKTAIKKKDSDNNLNQEGSLIKPLPDPDKNIVIQKTLIPSSSFQRKCHKKVTRLMLPYKKSKVKKPYYDQKDKEALQRMKKLRVDWTTKEDNLLLLCKVADVFMCPYALRKNMKNYSLIREIMHKNLPEDSLNKTSRACQRRLIYMMKNPHTAHSVAICIEELNQDKELVVKYGHAVMNRIMNKLKTDQQSSPGEEFKRIFNERYLELVTILLNRLKSVHFNKSLLEKEFIPDTLEEFYERYNVAIPCPKKRLETCSYREIENSSDVMSSVVKTIIHSSLACVADKTCYSYQLLHIYQQYPDKLLRSAMTEYRNSGVVSIKKYKRVNRTKAGELKCLPLSTAPFKLSNSYMNRLQTKYQHRIYSDSYYFFSNLISEMECKGSDSEMEFNVGNGGECALFVSLFSMGLLHTNIDFPEHVIILDPKLSETEETFSRILKRFNDLIFHIKNKNTDSVSNKGYETDYEDPDDQKYDCSSYEEFNYSNRNTLASAASRLALYSLRDTDRSEPSDANIQHAHDYFVINPCKISISLRPDDIDCLQTLFTDFPSKEETLNSLKRLSTFPSVDKRPKEEDVIKDLSSTGCKVLEFIKGGKDLGVKSSEVLQLFGENIVNDVCYMIDKQYILRSGSVSLRLIHYQFVKLWVVLSYSLPRSVKDSLATGSDRVTDMKEINSQSNKTDIETPLSLIQSYNPCISNIEKENAKELTNPLHQLRDKSQIANDASHDSKRKTVQVETLPLDSNDLPPQKKLKSLPKLAKFNKVIESKCLKDMEIVVKPWIRVDGSLNRRVLDRMLGSVLGHISFAPGISVEKLQTRFSPAIQPAQTHELVLILNDLDCVNMLKTFGKPECSLFSVRTEAKVTSATGMEEAHEIFLEPKPMAIVKLGLFIGDKSYSGIYMDLENFSFS